MKKLIPTLILGLAPLAVFAEPPMAMPPGGYTPPAAPAIASPPAPTTPAPIAVAKPSAADLAAKAAPASVGRGGAAAPRDLLAEQYFTNANPMLSKRETTALNIARRWQEGSATTMDVAPSADGVIRYQFGLTQPSVVCAVLQICDVELQAGEQVNSINLGDTTRWLVDPAITGVGSMEVQHLIIKPMDVGLETSLVVTTNRRTYHLRLRSHRSEYMPRIAFTYPEESSAKWEAIRSREVKDRKEATLPATGEYMGDLNFDYSMSGSASWKPVRVYNDGRKTILQMPSTMAQTEAPTLLIVRKDGGLFTDDETVMVNYRVQGDRYIVDTIFDKAILIAGVGSSQDKVTIQRGK